MKKISWHIMLICVLILVNSCRKDNSNTENLRIICEDFRPYNYLENSKIKGISVEIADTILGLLGQGSAPISITTNWDSAYNLLKTSDDVVLFTTDMTLERKNEFKWVGPVSVSATGFIGLKSSALEVYTIDEAKNLLSVGVVTGYSTAETLEDLSFNNLVYFTTIDAAIAALYDGGITAMFDLVQPVRAIASAAGKDVNLLDEVYIYSTVQGYFAFSALVSDGVVNSWQEKLDYLKSQGYVQVIYDKYLPGVKAPGLVTIYTEQNPPQSFTAEDGTLTGSSVEIVESMMDIIGKNDLITLTTWPNAYNQIQFIPNSMAFSTLRTPERESMFKWVGPICKKNYCFFVTANSSIELNVIDDAKTLSVIGVPEGWAAENELYTLGFTNIETWPTPEIVFEKLMTGEADAVVLNDISIDYLAGETGYEPENVRNELLLSHGETYLAFSLDTQETYIQQWQQAYNTINSNGTFAGIWNKWYPGINW